MGSLHAYLQQHRGQALALVLLALCMKALLPGGFMLAQQQRTLVIQFCHDAAIGSTASQLIVPLQADPDHQPADAAKRTCPYGALSMASTGGADPLIVALAIAFALLLGFAPVRIAALARVGHLRPPLRGPPA